MPRTTTRNASTRDSALCRSLTTDAPVPSARTCCAARTEETGTTYPIPFVIAVRLRAVMSRTCECSPCPRPALPRRQPLGALQISRRWKGTAGASTIGVRAGGSRRRASPHAPVGQLVEYLVDGDQVHTCSASRFGSRSRMPHRRSTPNSRPLDRTRKHYQRYATQELTACSQMATFRECSRSARRRSTRGGWTAAGVRARARVLVGSSGWSPETREMRGPWAKACRSCASTTDRATGVFQEAGPHDRRAAGRRGQADPEPGHRDGPAPRTKPVGGRHDQDRHFTLRRRRAPPHAGGNGRLSGSFHRGSRW